MEVKKKKDAEGESTYRSKERKKRVNVRLREMIENVFLFRSNVCKCLQSRRKKTTSLLSLATSKFCKRQLHKLSINEMFYLSLYNEGLLTHNVMTHAEDSGKINYVGIAFEYPVLNICFGFDLIAYDNKHFLTAVLTSLAGANDPTAWHRTVLDHRVPCASQSMPGGLPVSLWLEVMEPTVAALILAKKASRHTRTNITKRKKPSPLHRDPRVTIGDVQQTFFMVGPQRINHPVNQRHGVVAIYAQRRGELGQRLVRRGNRYTPVVTRIIPLTREHRESTRNRPPRQEPVPSWRVRRSKSAPNIAGVDSRLTDEMIHELNQIMWNRYMNY